jgi:hypothetical protein
MVDKRQLHFFLEVHVAFQAKLSLRPGLQLEIVPDRSRCNCCKGTKSKHQQGRPASKIHRISPISRQYGIPRSTFLQTEGESSR